MGLDELAGCIMTAKWCVRTIGPISPFSSQPFGPANGLTRKKAIEANDKKIGMCVQGRR